MVQTAELQDDWMMVLISGPSESFLDSCLPSMAPEPAREDTVLRTKNFLFKCNISLPQFCYLM